VKYMMIITLLLSLFSCEDLTTKSYSFKNDPSVDTTDDLTEVGNMDDDVSDDSSLEGVENVCDVFSSEHSGQSSLFSEVFSNLEKNCSRLSEKKKSTLMLTQSFISQVFKTYDESQSKICHKLAKRSLRKMHLLMRRKQKIESSSPKIMTLKSELTKERLDSILRKMMKHRCLIESFENVDYSDGDLSETYVFNNNYTINGSFEVFKDKDAKRKLTSLEDGWTIVDSSNIPGWKVRAILESGSDVKCDYLEIQSSGVVTNAFDGDHLVELDGNCTRNGQLISGSANVEITQKVTVARAGQYRFSLRAQKRAGKYGDLEISAFQKKKDQSFYKYELDNSKEWTNVCLDVAIDDPLKNVSLVIKDSKTDDLSTYGLLIDDVKFEQGSCP